MQFYPRIKSGSTPVIQRSFQGINRNDRFSIQPQFATDAKNISGNGFPCLTVRPGNTVMGAQYGRVLGMGVWKGTELHAVFADGTWRVWMGSFWSAALASGLSTTAEWSFANFQGNLAGIGLIGSNGVDPVKVYDGATVSNLATAYAGSNYIEQYADRLYAAVGNTVHFTAYRMANDWTTASGDEADSGYIVVETPDGELVSGLRTGSRRLTIFKPNSIHDLFGNSASDFHMTKGSGRIGAVSNQAITSVDSLLYFIHFPSGIYSYGGGAWPSKEFSQPVQAYVDRINLAAKYKCCAGTDGKRLYFGLPLDAATDPDTILEYNPEFGIWSVWKDYQPTHMALMGSDLYIGNVDGKVRKVGGTTDNGTAVSWNWVSKPFGNGSLAQKIRWIQMWVVADVPAGSTLNVYLSKSAEGDADWQLAKTVTASGTLSGTRIIVPTSMVADANWIRYKLEGTGSCTIREVSREEMQMPLV